MIVEGYGFRMQDGVEVILYLVGNMGCRSRGCLFICEPWFMSLASSNGTRWSFRKIMAWGCGPVVCYIFVQNKTSWLVLDNYGRIPLDSLALVL